MPGQMRENVTKPRLGRALRRLREAQKLTQLEVSRRARENGSLLGAEVISGWENGRRWPTIPSLLEFLDAVGCDFTDLQRALAGVEAADLAESGAGMSSEMRTMVATEMRIMIATVIGESEEVDGLQRRIRDLEQWRAAGGSRS